MHCPGPVQRKQIIYSWSANNLSREFTGSTPQRQELLLPPSFSGKISCSLNISIFYINFLLLLPEQQALPASECHRRVSAASAARARRPRPRAGKRGPVRRRRRAAASRDVACRRRKRQSACARARARVAPSGRSGSRARGFAICGRTKGRKSSRHRGSRRLPPHRAGRAPGGSGQREAAAARSAQSVRSLGSAARLRY